MASLLPPPGFHTAREAREGDGWVAVTGLQGLMRRVPGNPAVSLRRPHRLPHRDGQADAAIAAEAVVDFLEAVDEVADVLAIGGAAGGGAEVGAAAEGGENYGARNYACRNSDAW